MSNNKVPGGNLPDLANRINQSHQRCQASFQESVNAVIECGQLLIEAKKKLPHGEWLPWLARETKISPRQSQKFMRIAQYGDVVREKANSESFFNIEKALAALNPPRKAVAASNPLGNGAMDALAKDFEVFRQRAAAIKILEVLQVILEIELSPQAAASEICKRNDVKLLRSAEKSTAAAVAWLGDFGRELQRHASSEAPSLKVIRNEDPRHS